jgi:hypothetical protein
MAPILKFATSLGSKKKEPRYACLSEAKAPHSHITLSWNEVSSSVPQQYCNVLRVQKKEPRHVCQKRPSKSPLREPPSMFHLQSLYGERCSISRANCLFIHSYVSESPKRSPPTKFGEYMQSLSIEPHTDGQPTYNGEQPGSPRGSLTTVLSTTPVPHSLQHNTFHLGLGRPEPH